MPINWKETGSYERLLAAIIAANDMKVDYKRIAHFYGQGATYDSIEGRFRKAKKDAQALKNDAAGVPMPTSRSQPSTPRKIATPKSVNTPGSRKRKAKHDSDDSGVDSSEVNELRASATPSSRGKRAASKSAKYTFDSSHDDTAGEDVPGYHDDSLDEINDGQFDPNEEDRGKELKGTQDVESAMEA